jgi:hypothetical protein
MDHSSATATTSGTVVALRRVATRRERVTLCIP